MSEQPCEHDFVDRVVHSQGGWSGLTKLVIYCRKCGLVTYDHYQ